MTPKKYTQMKTLPIENWTADEAREADKLVKMVTLENVTKAVASWDIPEALREWIMEYVSFGYGSVETDTMLTKMGLYPVWM
jgi:hypothetical protein